MKLDLKAEHLAIAQRILSRLAPAGSVIWVFGSRAQGRAKAASDLDLAIDAGRAMTLTEATALAEAFDEALLPFRVDLVDLHSVTPAFKLIIERSRLPLPAGTAAL